MIDVSGVNDRAERAGGSVHAAFSYSCKLWLHYVKSMRTAQSLQEAEDDAEASG